MGMAAIGLKTVNSLPVSRILQRWSGSSFSSKAPTHASTCSRRPPTSQACRNPAGPSTQPLSDAGWQAAAQDAIHWPSRGPIEACNGHAGRPTAASNQHFSNQAEGPGHSVTRHHARLQPGATKSQHMQGGQHTVPLVVQNGGQQGAHMLMGHQVRPSRSLRSCSAIAAGSAICDVMSVAQEDQFMLRLKDQPDLCALCSVV